MRVKAKYLLNPLFSNPPENQKKKYVRASFAIGIFTGGTVHAGYFTCKGIGKSYTWIKDKWHAHKEKIETDILEAQEIKEAFKKEWEEKLIVHNSKLDKLGEKLAELEIASPFEQVFIYWARPKGPSDIIFAAWDGYFRTSYAGTEALKYDVKNFQKDKTLVLIWIWAKDQNHERFNPGYIRHLPHHQPELANCTMRVITLKDHTDFVEKGKISKNIIKLLTDPA